MMTGSSCWLSEANTSY